MENPMAGNSKAISVRINAANYHKARGQRMHDLRLGRIPNYVAEERIVDNSILIENVNEGVLKSLCDQRRSGKQRAMKRTAAVGSRGIITFGKQAQFEMAKLSPSKQDEAFQAVADAIAEHLASDLVGLVVHRDERAIHAHFLLPAWREDGQAISKVLTRKTSSQLQDVALETIKPFAPKIERGNKKIDRLRDGDKPSDVINKSVRQLHEELPAEIAEKQKELDVVLKKLATNEDRLAKLRKLEELTEKELKRMKAYQRRADDAKRKARELEDEIVSSTKLVEDRQKLIDNQKIELASLEKEKHHIQNQMEFSEDGVENFQRALSLQSEAMDAALALDPETPEIIQRKYAEATNQNGKPVQFCTSEPQDNFVRRFIRYSFSIVSDFYQKAKRSIAIKEQFHGFPEPLTQMVYPA